MTEHKSSLKALEPVEIRLAAAVRLRHEIARLRLVEETLDTSAREIAISVVGSEFAEIVLKVVGKPFAASPDLFDQSAIETFLAKHHELRLGTAALISPLPPGASAAGSTALTWQPAGAPQQAPSAPQQSQGKARSAAVAARLSAYEVELPEDYCGVMFDMIKRPEANLIMGEAILTVIDGSSLDASPYKADRGKVHWRRKLFEKTFLRFEANPPRMKSALEPEEAVRDEASPTAAAQVVQQPGPESAPELEPSPTTVPVAAAVPVPNAAEASGREWKHSLSSTRAEAEVFFNPASTVVTSELRPSESVKHTAPAGDGRAGVAAFDPPRPAPTVSGKTIEISGAPNALQDADEADDLLYPFKFSLPSRSIVVDAGPKVHAAKHAAKAEEEDVVSDEAAADPAGVDDETPTYDGPNCETPSENAEADLDRSFDDRIHHVPRGYGSADAGAMRADRLNPAVVAAVAEAAATPLAEWPEVPRLPAGGVLLRPPIPMLITRPSPAAPLRPAMAPPGSFGPVAPLSRPALSGTGNGGRLAPRPVSVRPPGM
ncbi:hypothetical protein [Methylobacterium radiotolerans]